MKKIKICDKYVLLEWCDITMAPPELEETKRMPPLIFYSMGRVLYEDKKVIEITANWGKEHPEFESKFKYRSRITIPQGCIVKKTYLAEKKGGGR